MRLPGVAEVVYDHPGEPELDNQVSSLGADTGWSSGFDGGLGCWCTRLWRTETHEALSGHTFYENMAANGNHGTGVACMYRSTNATYKGWPSA